MQILEGSQVGTSTIKSVNIFFGGGGGQGKELGGVWGLGWDGKKSE